MKKTIEVCVDRAIGFIDNFNNKYPVNYGYAPGIIGGDGEEQDAYILGVDHPVEKYEGFLIAVVHRRDDIETKWVVSNSMYSKEEIEAKVHFLEQYFDSYVELVDEV